MHRKTICAFFVAMASFCQSSKMLTGTHFPSTGDFRTLKALGYDFAVITLNPHDNPSWEPALDAAEAAGIKLIVGGYPPPYLFDNVKWELTGSAKELFTLLKSRANLILALYVFNEPYSTNPYASEGAPCGYFGAADLRDLRKVILDFWPEAKIYHDLGEPSDWAPGSAYTKATPCVGNKYADQTGVADYAGIWYNPFTMKGYEKDTALAALRREADFVRNSMKPAVAMSLNQAYACRTCSPGFLLPPADQLLDWNCATRSLPLAAIAWYPWRKFAAYEEAFADRPFLWPMTTAEACGAGMGSSAIGVSTASGMPFVSASSLVSVYGSNLASTTAVAASLPLSTTLGGATVQVRDSSGAQQTAQLAYVSPAQINFVLPEGVTPGQASLSIKNGSNAAIAGTAVIRPVAPALFTADGSGKGAAAATAVRVASDGNQTAAPVYQCAAGKCNPVQIDLPADSNVYLTLYGTGIRNHASDVICTINGASIPVLYAGAQGQYPGLDQVNVGPVGHLGGSGEVDLALTVDGDQANVVRVNFR